MYAPSIRIAARQGNGFGIGANLVGFPPRIDYIENPLILTRWTFKMPCYISIGISGDYIRSSNYREMVGIILRIMLLSFVKISYKVL